MRNDRKVPLDRINYVLSKLAFVRITIDWNITVHLFHKFEKFLYCSSNINRNTEKLHMTRFYYFASVIFNVLIKY